METAATWPGFYLTASFNLRKHDDCCPGGAVRKMVKTNDRISGETIALIFRSIFPVTDYLSLHL